MRGEFWHKEILARRLRQTAEACGATVQVEVTVRVNDVPHYIDLLFEKGGRRFVAEPEQTSRRVHNDVAKAVAVGAELLLIVTSDAPTAHACQRRLQRLPIANANLKVIACPLGAALEILRQTLNNANGQAARVAPALTKEP